MREPLLPIPFERRTPATGLERAANGVMDSECVNIKVTNPGAGLCIKGVKAY